MSTHSERKLAAIMFTNMGVLKLMPFCDLPRGDPRFEKIAASLVPKESAAVAK